MQRDEWQYAGFWVRTSAAIVDAILLTMVTVPLLIAVYGWSYFDIYTTGVIAGPAEILITWVFPAFAVVWFWIAKQATPGKMALSTKIVDAATGGAPSPGQMIGRYFAYLIATIPLGLGILWVAFDKRKQGWHDKLAGTVVVRQTRPEPVRFGPR